MLYSVLTDAAQCGLPELIYITILFLICGALLLFVHELIGRLCAGQPVGDAWRARLNDPNTYLSLVCFAVFGVGWFRTAENNCEKRGKRLLVGLSGPLSALIISFVSVIMISLTKSITVLYLLFKVLFRVSAYGALFSLLPLMPYDGGQILLSVLPSKWQSGYAKSEDFSVVLMLTAVLTLTILGKIPPMAI